MYASAMGEGNIRHRILYLAAIHLSTYYSGHNSLNHSLFIIRSAANNGGFSTAPVKAFDRLNQSMPDN